MIDEENINNEEIKKQLKRIFGVIEPRYFVRAYIISMFLTFISIWFINDSNGPVYAIFLSIIMGLLHPFSKLVYDEIIGLMMGGTVLIMNVIVLFMWKFIINMLLFIFSPLIAPLGMLYLWLCGRGNEKEQ